MGIHKRIDKNDMIVPSNIPFDGVGVEYTFLQYRTYLELITFRDIEDRFFGIEFKLNKQEPFKDEDGKIYDKLIMDVTAYRDHDFEELKEEWESSFFDKDFDRNTHEKKVKKNLYTLKENAGLKLVVFMLEI